VVINVEGIGIERFLLRLLYDSQVVVEYPLALGRTAIATKTHPPPVTLA
jgi:hypothetical protein